MTKTDAFNCLFFLPFLLFSSCKKEETRLAKSNSFHVLTDLGEFRRTKDGGFSVFDPETNSLTKYNAYGKIIWSKSYNNLVSGLNQYSFNAYANCNDNGFGILGSWRHYLYSLRFEYFIKTDANGEVEWTNVCDTLRNSGYDLYEDFIQTTNGNYFGLFENYSPGYSAIKFLSPDANPVYRICDPYDYRWYQNGKLSSTGNGGFYLLAQDFDTQQPYLTKQDSNGCFLWTIPVFIDGVGTQNHLYVTDLRATDQGGCLVSGHTNIRSTNYDYFVIEYNQNGNQERIKKVGTDYNDYCFSMLKTRDGGILLAGSRSSNPLLDHNLPDPSIDFNSTIYIVKLSNSFNIEWERILGTHTGSAAILTNEDADGFVLLTQQNSYGNITLEQKMFIRLDQNGNYAQ